MNEDFSLGKMSADARLTATFKYYAKTEQNGEIIITACLGKGDVPKLNRGYGLDGNELWLSLNNLYQSIRGKDDYTAADDIISWCQQYAHPYYASEDIEEYRWDIEKDTEYWDFSTNILGNFTFDVHTMREDLESLYRDTLVILMFKKCLERLDVSTDLAQITDVYKRQPPISAMMNISATWCWMISTSLSGIFGKPTNCLLYTSRCV